MPRSHSKQSDNSTTPPPQAELTPDVQLAILQRKLQMWLNTRYDAEIDIRLAKRLDENDDEAKARLKKAEKAIDGINEMIAELGDGA